MKLLFTSISLLLSLLLYSQTYDIYVCDAGDFNNGPWQILKFDSNGENPEIFIENDLFWPQDILFLEDSNFVLISNFLNGKISRYDVSSGTYMNDFAIGIGGPTRMKVGEDNLLYVLQWEGNGLVKRYSLDGTFVDNFTDTSVPESIGLDWDENGNLYVSSHGGDLVRKFNPNGEDMGIFINSDLVGPTNIWIDENGDLLVSDYNGTAVKRFNSDGVYQNDFLSGLNHSEGVAHLPNGNILIGNGATSSVKMFSSNGIYLEDIISSGLGGLINPNAITIKETNIVSVPELKSHFGDIIYPSLGAQFYIKRQFVNSIKLVRVYNSVGILIDSFSKGLWDGNEFNNGAYIMAIEFTDGRTTKQKIIVKK